MKQVNKLQKGNFLLYSFDDSAVQIEVYFKDENIWLSQKLMAELFDVDRSVITKHLKNVFEAQELDEKSVSAKIAHTASDGKNYTMQFYI